MTTLIPVFLATVAGEMGVAAHPEPAPGSGDQRVKTLYVSKLGDNTTGASWGRAFTTIQAALQAIPNERGGVRILIRPDTYFEANLFPAHPGAKDAYNELVGDTDGRFGSGTTGWVVIDSGDPAQKGFKSYDWWSTVRAYAKGWSPKHKGATFSAIGWDRWRVRNLYVTGSDAGLFFDCTNQVKPFTVVVEDCCSFGRAFGGGVASCLSRHDEPITFRRCKLWSLDYWGDTAGAYVRVENKTMPAQPDVVFEDCSLVGPQCALKAGNFGFQTFTHVRLARCTLVLLNFTQPENKGPTPEGIIQSVQEGKYLHVDLEDCTLMGRRVFGVIVKKDTVSDIQYTTRGDVKAYVQFRAPLPQGFYRLPSWPVDVFQSILPVPPPRQQQLGEREIVHRGMCELSPFIWKDRLCHLECVRPGHGGERKEYYLLIKDAETGKELARFAEGYGLASIVAARGAVYAFASRWDNGSWRDVTQFRSSDLRKWQSKVVIQGEHEGIFNTSVCEGPDGYVMAYESNDPAYPAFTVKFAISKDLEEWRKQPLAVFGTNRYTACPCIRYANGFYYMLYLEHRAPRHFYQTYIARSKDLLHWEQSAANPVLTPEGLDEGVNASDPELIEYKGKTYVYFAVGDQLSWMNLKRAAWPGTLGDFLESWFRTAPIPEIGTAASSKRRADR